MLCSSVFSLVRLLCFQVCSGKSSHWLLLQFLRCLDVRCHLMGDVHLLRRTLVWSVRPTGTHVSSSELSCCAFVLLSALVEVFCPRVWNACPALGNTYLVSQSLSSTWTYSFSFRFCGAWNARASDWRSRRTALRSSTLSWGSAGPATPLTDPALPSSSRWWQRS